MKLLREFAKLLVSVYVQICIFLIRIILPLAQHPKAQAKILRQTATLLSAELKSFGKNIDIEVNRRGTSYSKAGQIVLSNDGTDRYLKSSEVEVFAGSELFSKLSQLGIHELKTIIDVGANFGEVSLCFAQAFPGSVILAVEPVATNIAIFEENIARQSFDTSNINILKFAVSDQPGDAKITNHLGSQNSIVAKRGLSHSKYEIVPCIRLDEIFEKYGIDNCSFLKIDIEGAEPGIKDGLANILSKTKCVLIEFSYKNTPENYQMLVDVFKQAEHRWRCYESNQIGKEILLEDVMTNYNSIKSGKPARDYWFVRS